MPVRNEWLQQTLATFLKRKRASETHSLGLNLDFTASFKNRLRTAALANVCSSLIEWLMHIQGSGIRALSAARAVFVRADLHESQGYGLVV